MVIPNIIDPTVPIGKDDSENVEVERFGEPLTPDFEVPYHTEIMERFDGIDLDWEYPNTTLHPEERHLHTEMLRMLREKLDALDRKYYLSVAVPDCEWTFRITELDESQKYLDYINVMTYDMNRRDCTSHHAAPYSADETKYASAFSLLSPLSAIV